ncbi:unnamed protein product [Adineta steineri]|uniref:Uncharacterized protein n=1 Tax=Adineta steineri TaxID=433720 RepID=A0A813ZT11_9BILA|nr:unnamed protein product [Adineta steineri]
MELQNTYDTNLKCPCTEISASYRSFVEIIPTYHEICSSDFVSQKWIDMLFNDQTSTRYVLDFRATASQQFQVLRELCKFSQTAINNDIQGLYDDQLISAYLLSESLLQAEMVSFTTTFRTSSVANALRSLSFMRTDNNANMEATRTDTGKAYMEFSYRSQSVQVITSTTTIGYQTTTLDNTNLYYTAHPCSYRFNTLWDVELRDKTNSSEQTFI